MSQQQAGAGVTLRAPPDPLPGAGMGLVPAAPGAGVPPAGSGSALPALLKMTIKWQLNVCL